MRMVATLCFWTLLCLWSVPVVAANGVIPIWKATTIAQPGTYVVTRNVINAGTVIEITSDDVHLDLNGFTLQNSTDTGYVIRCSQVEGVTVENGTVLGGGVGISINGKDVEVRRVKIATSGTGLSVLGYDVRLDQNLIRSASYEAIFLDVCEGCRISGNVIGGTDFGGGGADTVAYGVYVDARMEGSQVVDNIVYACANDGMSLTSGNGNFIRNNTVRGCRESGMRVAGSYNHISENVLTGNDYGLRLGGADNVYRGNMARGNWIADFSNTGSGNTSHGDNYMPGQM